MAGDSQKKLGPIAILTVPLFIVALVFTVVLTASTANCSPSGSGGGSVSVDPDSVPDINIGGYGHEQLVNAAHIITAGEDLGLNARDQTIGVMTAMGESSLRVIILETHMMEWLLRTGNNRLNFAVSRSTNLIWVEKVRVKRGHPLPNMRFILL